MSKTMKGRIINQITSHPVITFGIAVVVGFLPLAVVLILSNCLKADSSMNNVVNWIRADLLEYLGMVLSYIGTIALSIVAVWQNNEHSKLTYALQKQIIDMEIERQSPKFTIGLKSTSGNFMELKLNVTNASESAVSDFRFTGLYEVIGGKRQADSLMQSPTNPTVIPSGSLMCFPLNSKYASSQNPTVCFCFECKDVYGNLRCYEGTISGDNLGKSAPISIYPAECIAP